MSSEGSEKTFGYCWPISFQVREVLFLVSVPSAFLPSKKACGTHTIRHFGVGQQYPLVFETLPRARQTRGHSLTYNMSPLANAVKTQMIFPDRGAFRESRPYAPRRERRGTAQGPPKRRGLVPHSVAVAAAPLGACRRCAPASGGGEPTFRARAGLGRGPDAPDRSSQSPASAGPRAAHTTSHGDADRAPSRGPSPAAPPAVPSPAAPTTTPRLRRAPGAWRPVAAPPSTAATAAPAPPGPRPAAIGAGAAYGRVAAPRRPAPACVPAPAGGTPSPVAPPGSAWSRPWYRDPDRPAPAPGAAAPPAPPPAVSPATPSAPP